MTEATNTDLDEGRHIEIFTIHWQHLTIEITYEACWLSMPHNEGRVAHLAVRSIAPKSAPLPITETGYRSHFTSPDTIAGYGGPVTFVQGWLDQEARSPAWLARQAEARQFTLF